MNQPVIVIGGGGHAKVIIDTLIAQSAIMVGFTDPNPKTDCILGVNWIGDDKAVYKYSSRHIQLINGIGSIGRNGRRGEIFKEFRAQGYFFAKVVHPSAIIASDVELSEGVQIMAGAIIQAGCRIGEDVILNTGVSIDHDCFIGSHVHLAPRATVSGGVQVGDGVHIGPGATIVQGVKLGRGSIIGAGALVLKDVPENVTVIGVPAKES